MRKEGSEHSTDNSRFTEGSWGSNYILNNIQTRGSYQSSKNQYIDLAKENLRVVSLNPSKTIEKDRVMLKRKKHCEA